MAARATDSNVIENDLDASICPDQSHAPARTLRVIQIISCLSARSAPFAILPTLYLLPESVNVRRDASDCQAFFLCHVHQSQRLDFDHLQGNSEGSLFLLRWLHCPPYLPR